LPRTARISSGVPGEEPSLLALAAGSEAVRVGGRVEGPLRRRHVALHVAQDLAGDGRELLASSGLVALEVGHGEEGVVVERLLEKPPPVREVVFLPVDDEGREIQVG
jgi:hypothetical protein